MSNFWSIEDRADKFLKFMPPLKQKLYKQVADFVRERQITDVLDFGCGNGNQIEFLDNNIKIGLYDINKTIANDTFLKYTQTKNVFLIDDITNNTTSKFNAIIVNMVWMCLNGEFEVNEFFKQLKQLKQENGIIILSMTHPCFRNELFSYYHTAFTTSEKLFDYTKEGDAFDVVIKNEEHSVFTDYHYSLTLFFKKLKEFELEMIDFVELCDEEYNLTVNKRFTPYILTTLK